MTNPHEPYQPPPVPLLLDALTANVTGRTAWDENPEWGLLSWNGRTVELSAWPTPPEAWERFPSAAHLLVSFLQLLSAPSEEQREASDMMRDNLPATFCGVYLVVEAWAPPAHMEEVLHKRRAAGADELDYEELPDRRELRTALAADTHGRHYVVELERGKDGVRLHDQDGHDGMGMQGLPVLLCRIVTTFMSGRTAPATRAEAPAEEEVTS